MRRLDLVTLLALSMLLIAALPVPGIPPHQSARSGDWVATDAFGDVAARAGWRPVTDWVFEEGVEEPRVIPGAGVILDPTGDAGDLYTLASYGDLEVSGEFCLSEGARVTLRFLGRYDVQFSERAGDGDPIFGDPGSIIGSGREGGIAPRIGIECAPRIWHRFSVTLRAPRFDARGVRTEPARFLRVLLDGVIVQVGVELSAPSPDAPAFEVAEAPFALRSAAGAVAFRKLAGRPLELGDASITPERMAVSPLARVVVFSRTAKFRHGSIPVALTAIRGLGKHQGFAVVTTEDPEQLLEWLDGTDVVVFLNTTGDVLNDAQQPMLEAYLRTGGGFLGIHAAADTEYDWPWYGELVGAYFSGHPHIQDARVNVVDRAHPATAMLPAVWTRRDEWYNYAERPPANTRILATLDVTSYEGSTMGEGHPTAWCREVAGGRSIYIGGGHTNESYAEPLFLAHLLGALRWAAGDDRIISELPENLVPPVRDGAPTNAGETDGGGAAPGATDPDDNEKTTADNSGADSNGDHRHEH